MVRHAIEKSKCQIRAEPIGEGFEMMNIDIMNSKVVTKIGAHAYHGEVTFMGQNVKVSAFVQNVSNSQILMHEVYFPLQKRLKET